MIDFVKKENNFYLILGFDFHSKEPKRLIPITLEEVREIALNFNEEFAKSVSENEVKWSLNDLKLTDAPDHPYGWNNNGKRTKFFFKSQSWHMEVWEIAEIGRLAKKMVG
jgi:hypothetical protein